MMVSFTQWTCGQCGSVQAMTDETMRVLRASSATFYCVHGHARSYPQGESRETVLQRERDRLAQRVAQRDDEIARQRRLREAAERSASAYKGQTTRLRNRARAGVCPCCNRTFAQLARHMATQHPQFTPDAPEPARDGAPN